MKHTIKVHYPLATSEQIMVDYTMEQQENLQTISCSVAGAQVPVWLQIRKFSVSSINRAGVYTTLFSEVNNSKNMDTSLFIDLVYASIMAAERLQCS